MSNGRDRARDLFRSRVRSALSKAEAEFEGAYAEELDELLGLSRADILAVTPNVTNLSAYNQLISVVKEASRTNASQAALVSRIKSLGQSAVSIAKRVTGLGTLFSSN